MFDWEDLRHFAALARDGSLSAAARRLGVDHVTVARRVAALEAALGLKLVDRRPRATALTADGARIAALAEGMATAAEAIARAVRAAQPGIAGQVTVSAPPALASSLLAPRLDRLAARHPGLQLRLIGEKRTASLARGEADVALRLSRPTEPSLVARRIGRFGFALYAAPGYLAARTPDAYGFIAYDESADELPQQRWLASIVGSRPIVLRTSELEAQRAAARAGLGVALLPRFMADGEPGLAPVDAAGALPEREAWLVVHADLQHAPAVRAVMAFLAECMG